MTSSITARVEENPYGERADKSEKKSPIKSVYFSSDVEGYIDEVAPATTAGISSSLQSVNKTSTFFAGGDEHQESETMVDEVVRECCSDVEESKRVCIRVRVW